ncbi:MAG: DUF1232 domain-containing protein [Bacteriovoracaceae bacterium]|nr:DUF1232 domain-containing protein [Bacteriovoracaceae bacterium]
MFTFIKTVGKFLKDVSEDPRIPERDKTVIVALVVLVLSPIDLIPDWIPVLGQLDDIVMIALIFDYFFKVLDGEVLLSHWPWGMKSFVWFRRFARGFSFLAPRFIKKKIWKYVGAPY